MKIISTWVSNSLQKNFLRTKLLAFAALTLATTQVLAVDVQITQYDDTPDPVPATQTVTYAMTVENSAADTANGVTVTASVPAGMSFVSVTPSVGTCAFSATDVQCALGNLLGTGSGGSPVTINIVMRATAGGGASPTTVATATTSSVDTNPSNNSLSQQTTITNGADLALSVTDSPDPVNGSGIVTYTLSPQNLGPDDVVNARIVNNLPPGVSLVSAVGSGWSCSQAGQVVTCNQADTQAPGALPQLVIQGRVNVGSGNITNSATISSPVTPDGIPANDTVLTTTAVNPGADLGVNKAVSPNPVIAGQATTFTLNTTNNGPSAASTVVVSDTLPAGFTGISASGAGWGCGVAGQTVTCNLASYTVGASSAITITATAPASVPPAGLATSNTASISSATYDGIGTNDTSTVNFNINPLQADLSLTKNKTPNPVAQGSNMTSTIVIRNNGPLAATSPISMTDSLAAGETFVSAAGTGWSCAHAAGVVTCSYGNLGVNANSNPLTITTTATNTGNLGNTACTGGSAIGGNTHPEGDVNAANDCATATSNSTGQIADLAIAKTIPVAADNPLLPTDNSLTYRLTISNNGPDTSTNVRVTDAIPMYTSAAGGTGLSFVPGAGSLGSSAGTCSNSGANITCNYPQLQNGESAVIDVTVTRPMLDGAFTNIANITSTSIGDPNLGNNSSSVSSTVNPVADVEMTGKTITPNPVRTGVNTSYVMSFRNNGPSTAENVVVTDVFSPAVGDTGFTVISVTPSKGSCAGLVAGTSYSGGTPTLTCNIGNMISAETQTVTLIIRPNYMAAPPAPRTLANTASVTTTTQESDGPPSTVNANNSKSATLTIDPALLDMLINKTDAAPYGPDPVGFDPVTPANNVFAYRIRVTNNGPSYATGVVFTDTINTPGGKNLSFLGDTAVLGAPAAGICSGTASPFTGTGIFTCTVPAGIAAGATYERILYFRAESSPASGGDTFSDSVMVTTNEADSNAGNNTATESTTVRVRSDLAVTSKTATPNTVNLREPFNWTIVVANNGPGDASNPRLSDTLPANMVLTATPTYTKSSPAGSGSCTGIAGATSFTCDFSTFNNGATATITVPVRINSFAASLTNSATISTQGNEVDPVSANNSNSGNVSMVKSSIAGVVYRDQNDDGAQSGAAETGIAGVQMQLTGTDAYGNAVSVVVTTNASGQYLFDNLPPSNPAGYTVVEVAQPAGFTDGKETAGTSGGTPGAAGTDIISAIVLPSNTAATGYLFGEVPVPLIGVAKSAGPTVNNGDGTYSVPFTITVTNSGGTPLSNIQITDDLSGTNATGKFGNYVAGVPAAGEYTLSSGPTVAAQTNGAAMTAGAFTGSGAGTGLLVPASSSLPNFGSGTASTAQVQFTVRFFPTTSGPFNNTAVATGTTPTGTNVTDNSVDGAQPDANGNGDPTDDTSPTVVNLSGQAIGVAKRVLGIVQTGAKRYRIPYSLIVENVSTAVTATNAQVTDSLATTFPTAQTIAIAVAPAVSACTGTALNPNAAFTGTSQNNLLVGNQNLQPGERCTIAFTTEIDFGANPLPAVVQNNQAVATTAQTPGGTVIATDLSDDGTAPDTDGDHNANESGENDPTPVSFAAGNLSSVSGTVYLDANHNRSNDDPLVSSRVQGFIVEVLNAAGTIVGTATTDASGNYTVGSLFPSTPGDASTYYSVRFREPVSGAIYGIPQSLDPTHPNGTISNGVITSLQLVAGVTTLAQNLPLDPSGVIYDSITRAPVAGAQVTLTFGGAPVPDGCLVGGVNTQTTGGTGQYQFLLINPAPPGCPGNGTYAIQVVQPGSYLAPASVIIPPTAGPYTPTNGGVDAIQAQSGPPTGAAPTTYYFTIALTLGVSSQVVNNHIPLDPILGGAIALSKTTPLVNVARGDLVPYTIIATNTLAATLPNIDIVDRIPPGFRYRSSSATLNAVPSEPTFNGRQLTWRNQSFTPNERKTIKLILTVGAGVSEGEYPNLAWAMNNVAGAQVSNTANATVRVIPDPTFDCSDIIGKVFDDKNANGWQDEGELGIPNVRVVTARGLLVTTDTEGRFHVACAAIPQQDHGANFVMKLDERTLPTGYRVTTENPRDVRVTRGKMVKLNFGATVHRVVRLELSGAAFIGETLDLAPNWAGQVAALPEKLKERPSVLRIAYRAGKEAADLGRRRLDALAEKIRSLWKERRKDDERLYPLVIETELEGAK